MPLEKFLFLCRRSQSIQTMCRWRLTRLKTRAFEFHPLITEELHIIQLGAGALVVWNSSGPAPLIYVVDTLL